MSSELVIFLIAMIFAAQSALHKTQSSSHDAQSICDTAQWAWRFAQSG